MHQHGFRVALRLNRLMPVRSVLYVSCDLTTLLLRLPLVVPAMRVRLLVGGAAVLLRVPGVLTRILTDVTTGAPLLCLLRCRRHVRPAADKHG